MSLPSPPSFETSGAVSYSATKSWMTVFTEGLYLELKSVGSNVTVQALCPGFTYSEFHEVMGVDRLRMAPRSFWMRAEDVVDASLEGLARAPAVRDSGLALPPPDGISFGASERDPPPNRVAQRACPVQTVSLK